MVTSALVVAMSGLQGCVALEESGILESAGLTALAGAGIGAGIGGAVGGRKGAVIGAAVGGISGFVIAKSYQASQAQKAQALAVGRQSVRSSVVKNSSKKYVAVPVKKQDGGGRDLMIVDKETGELASSQAYVPEPGSKYAAGDTITLGGRSAVIATAFQGI